MPLHPPPSQFMLARYPLRTHMHSALSPLQPSASLDLVFDKDAFGAVPPSLREAYVSQLSRAARPGALALLDVKLRADAAQTPGRGPPFHIDEAVVAATWGTHGWTIIEHLPQGIYPAQPGTGVSTHCFMLRLQPSAAGAVDN